MCAQKSNTKEKVQLEFVVCHRRPDRSFFWKGKQFPVCARCTGINIGMFSIVLFLCKILYFNWLWTFILIVPAYIDGLIQAYWDIESTNWRRASTGIISGIGLTSLIYLIGNFIGDSIYSWIH